MSEFFIKEDDECYVLCSIKTNYNSGGKISNICIFANEEKALDAARVLHDKNCEYEQSTCPLYIKYVENCAICLDCGTCEICKNVDTNSESDYDISCSQKNLCPIHKDYFMEPHLSDFCCWIDKEKFIIKSDGCFFDKSIKT